VSGFAQYPDFPLRDTLDGGTYLPDEHYLGEGADRLFLGHSRTAPGERFLISVSTDGGRELETVRPGLMRSSPGVFVPVFVGLFDAEGTDAARDRHRQTYAAFVERLPDGGPLSRVSPRPGPLAASLGGQVGRILKSALDTSELYVLGLRPEYVWARGDGNDVAITGIGGRNAAFFRSAGRGRDLPSAPLFTRKYYAPEVSRGEPFDDRALTLTLAVMVAEWATGEYPYEMDGAWGYWNLCEGRHRQLSLPSRFAQLLSAGMRPEPGDRPDLATFISELAVVVDGQRMAT
jgi:hypothetical protein